jgi:hypothetical protein
MTAILRKLLIVLVVGWGSFLAHADTRTLNAKCTLKIDGITHMDDRCHFSSHGDSDYFDDLRMQIVCPNGQSTDVAYCIGAEQRVTRKGVFGYLFRENGVARFCWNGGDWRKAQECFEGLRRTGACWENMRAPDESNPSKVSHIQLCAWRR